MKNTQTTQTIIRNGLERNNLTQTEFSNLLGVSKSWTARILNGSLKNLDIQKAKKIEKILGVTFNKVIGTHKISSVTEKIERTISRDKDLSEMMAHFLKYLDRTTALDQYQIPATELTILGKEIREMSINPDIDHLTLATKTIDLIKKIIKKPRREYC